MPTLVKLVRLVLCFFLLFGRILNSVSAKPLSHCLVVYSWEQLLVLSQARLTPGVRPEISAKLRRRRGCRAGVKLPSVITGNVRSLLNKMHELVALTRL